MIITMRKTRLVPVFSDRVSRFMPKKGARRSAIVFLHDCLRLS